MPATDSEGNDSVFIVDTKTAGVSVQGIDIGLSGERAAHLTLENVSLGSDAILGKSGQGGEILTWIEEPARCVPNLAALVRPKLLHEADKGFISNDGKGEGNRTAASVLPEVTALCEQMGVKFVTGEGIESVEDVDAIYLNGPRTVAHVELLKARDSFNVQIDAKFMSRLKSHCVILDPMQRSGDISIEVQDNRLAFYRQAENALYVRMALLSEMLAR